MVILLIVIILLIVFYYRQYEKKDFIRKNYYEPLEKKHNQNVSWERKGFNMGPINTVEKSKYKRLQQSNFHNMSGVEFEKYCMDLLSVLGYTDIKETSVTGDYGVDVLAKKRGETYGFQCKCYSQPVGIKAVQEIVSGIQFYKCNKAVVITNATFTKAAENLAKSANVDLWDGTEINKHLNTLRLKEEPANYYTAKQKLILRLLVSINNRKNEL